MHWIREVVAPSIDSGDGAGQHRFRGSGNVFEENVPAREQGGEHELDLLALAVHDRLDVVEQAGRQRRRAFEVRALRHVRICWLYPVR